METRTANPSFTVSLRGYDRVEVDEYLDSLAEAMAQIDETREKNRHLQSHIMKLNARIEELEERISSDTPRTGAVLGERIGVLLRQAEDAADDTIRRGQAKATELVRDAELQLVEAEGTARGTVSRGEEQARRIEAAARAEAAEVIAEAEARAAARTRQIEQWAEQVVSHTRAEEARMLREQHERKAAADDEMQALAARRDQVACTLSDLREVLGQALGLVVPVASPTSSADPAVRERSVEVEAPGTDPTDLSPFETTTTSLDAALTSTTSYTTALSAMAADEDLEDDEPDTAPVPTTLYDDEADSVELRDGFHQMEDAEPLETWAPRGPDGYYNN